MQKDTKDEMKETRIEYERANYKKDQLDYSKPRKPEESYESNVTQT